MVALLPSVPTRSKTKHRISLLVLPGVIPFDLACASEIFTRAELGTGERCYEVVVCGEEEHYPVGGYALVLQHGLSRLQRADTIIVPGTDRPLEAISSKVIKALQAAHRRGVRIASICSGAFALAQAGLLNGRRATTHWKAAELLASHHRGIQVDSRVLFIDEGSILTSAGAAAGLDMCLHMVRSDYGVTVAAHVARLSVVPLQREGGQAQFFQAPEIAHEQGLEQLVAWVLNRPEFCR